MNHKTRILADTAFLQGPTEALFGPGLTLTTAWTEFARSWDDLRQDDYMADGGRYRFRRYSEFRLAAASHELNVLPHVPYRQSKEDNYLNGGIDRLYSPMTGQMQANQAFRDVLFSCADVLAPLHPGAEWLVQVFQNRILANVGEAGKPTPEGVHRDGVDYVLTLLTERSNVNGGESASYAADGKTLKAAVTLKQPGDFIFLDDKLMKHSVLPVVRARPEEVGYRDVLIAMFTRRDQPGEGGA